MKKTLSKIIFISILMLSYKNNALAQVLSDGSCDPRYCDPAPPSELFSRIMQLLPLLLLISISLNILYLLGSYLCSNFYLKDKNDEAKKQKTQKHLKLAKKLLIINALFFTTYLFIFYASIILHN